LILPYMQKICHEDVELWNNKVLDRANKKYIDRAFAKNNEDYLLYEKENIYIAKDRYKNWE